MHEIGRWLIALAVASALWAAPAPAQQTTTRTAVLGAVMGYRLHWIGDSTAFDACRVFRVAGEPADFPAGIMQPLRVLLDQPVDPCRRTTSSTAPRNRVVVDSLSAGDSLAHVFLTVRRGERVHRENYILRTPRAQPGFVGVKTVTLWGSVQFYPGVERERQPRR